MSVNLDGVFAALEDYLRRALKPFADRIAALEAAKGEQQIGVKLDSLERRASRHAEHLSRLESRLQALEQKGGK